MWTLEFFYETSGGRGALIGPPQSFQTPAISLGTTYNFQTTAGYGGRITADAAITIGGQTTHQGTTFYEDGTSIPDGTIDTQLYNAFASVTLGSEVSPVLPYLMLGVAGRESSYMQFANPSTVLFGITGRWPVESSDGGGYIGLMMPPTSMTTAYNWTYNYSTAVGIYAQHYNDAVNYETTIIASCPLPWMTEQQLELNTLSWYSGNGGSRSNPSPYLIPNDTCTGWEVNNRNSAMQSYISGSNGVLQWCANRGHPNCQ